MPFPSQRILPGVLITLLLSATGCHRNLFPAYAAEYREYAYVTNGDSNTVAVLDLLYLRQDRVLAVGRNPTGITANPVRNEIYAVNSGSDSVSVIDATQNKVTATIGVHRTPYFIEVSADGKRGYVANSGDNTVSALDLVAHRELATAATGEAPGIARLSPDGLTLLVTNRVAGSVSIYSVSDSTKEPLIFRATFGGCPGATDAVVAASSPGYPTFGARAFITCSAGHQVMDLWLRATPAAALSKGDSSIAQDHVLALLDVGQSPLHLGLLPDSFHVYSANFNADSISSINAGSNEVEGTYIVGSHPSRVLAAADNSSLWVTNFTADTVALYSIDDGKLITAVRTGSAPDALALSSDDHVLLVANSRSGDIAVIRTQGKSGGPELVTMLPSGGRPNDIAIKHFNAR